MKKWMLVTFAVAGLPYPGSAQDAVRDRVPPALQRLLDCRSIGADRERLACFDAELALFDAAAKRGDVAVVDREKVEQTRRSLFGFALPEIGNLFGHRGSADQDDRDQVKELTGTIRSVSGNSDGGVIVTLDDGARWEQTDSVMLGRKPRPGETVTIRRAALGSFKMSFAAGPGVRAHRIG